MPIQKTPITNECTPLKKLEFDSLRRERIARTKELETLEANRRYYVVRSFLSEHRKLVEKIDDVKAKMNAILN